MTNVTHKNEIRCSLRNHGNIRFTLPSLEQTLIDRPRQDFIPIQIAYRTCVDRHARHVLIHEELVKGFVMWGIEPIEVTYLDSQAHLRWPSGEKCLKVRQQLWGITRRQLQEHRSEPRP